MARPKKWRRVCILPEVNTFGPIDISESTREYIHMTVEEYETIRLMDLEGLNQEESADVMGVARSTIQRIYDNARKKLAESLVNGKVLKIEGGDYKLCNEFDDQRQCNRRTCRRNKHKDNVLIAIRECK
ncbi:protein of unknown function DUF134 [Desulforamulus reducens MI-1]|uniref:UPF0251 protein Dred_2217 n=1 Tax=Desulforamulus reducens (strain ATCC BAA-1160 / DSM 100696 / MI-1) TaxID=349161 RepID=A4J6M8_DESRM|nr:DUF134 domain-containing protein [Desulforamulus reducens]ABO50731.1 protein of unknown function DUF134 [Desulforamulus reducens MI-1]